MRTCVAYEIEMFLLKMRVIFIYFVMEVSF